MSKRSFGGGKTPKAKKTKKSVAEDTTGEETFVDEYVPPEEDKEAVCNAFSQPMATEKDCKKTYKRPEKASKKVNELGEQHKSSTIKGKPAVRGRIKAVQRACVKGGKGICIPGGDVTPIDKSAAQRSSTSTFAHRSAWETGNRGAFLEDYLTITKRRAAIAEKIANEMQRDAEYAVESAARAKTRAERARENANDEKWGWKESPLSGSGTTYDDPYREYARTMMNIEADFAEKSAAMLECDAQTVIEDAAHAEAYLKVCREAVKNEEARRGCK